MTKINLAEIEARAEKATPGKWVFDGDKFDDGYNVYATEHPHIKIVRADDNPNDKADAEFIAHAREDVPALIAEVKKLRKALGFYADSTRYGGRDENGLAAIEYDAGTTADIALGNMAVEVFVGNIIQCRYCEDIIRSLTPDDITYCTCGRVGVSGGDDELVRHCDMHEFRELSFEEAD